MTQLDHSYSFRPVQYTDKSKRERLNKLLHGCTDREKLSFQWDDEALWSLTNLKIGEDICARLLDCEGITNSSIITDAMASVGGNAIMFAKAFAHVNAVEVNTARKKMLACNVELFGLCNVRTFHAFYQDIMYSLAQDAVFLDPPWGKNYRKHKAGTMRIMITGSDSQQISLEGLVVSLRGRALYCVVKLPFNYDMKFFEASIKPVGTIVDTVSYRAPYTSVIKYIRFKPK